MKKITSAELTNLIFGSKNDRLMVAWDGLLYKYMNIISNLGDDFPAVVDNVIDFIIDHHKKLRIYNISTLTTMHEINLWDYKGELIPEIAGGVVDIYPA